MFKLRITTECVIVQLHIRCVALIGKYKMRKLYIILSVINKSVYLTGRGKVQW